MLNFVSLDFTQEVGKTRKVCSWVWKVCGLAKEVCACMPRDHSKRYFALAVPEPFLQHIQWMNSRKRFWNTLDSSSWFRFRNHMDKQVMSPKQFQSCMVDVVTGSTLTGTFASAEQVCLECFSLPNFHPKWTLPKLKAWMLHAEFCCDMIVGHNVFKPLVCNLISKMVILFVTEILFQCINFLTMPLRPLPLNILSQDCLCCN